MVTIVGATLASSKLAVMQDDLHLVDSSVDQLIVQFDQMVFDEFLAADQIEPNMRHHFGTRHGPPGGLRCPLLLNVHSLPMMSPSATPLGPVLTDRLREDRSRGVRSTSVIAGRMGQSLSPSF